MRLETRHAGKVPLPRIRLAALLGMLATAALLGVVTVTASLGHRRVDIGLVTGSAATALLVTARMRSDHHVDHVVTEAAERAARRAIEASYSDDQPRVPFHELAREEQRKMLRVVRPGDD